MDDLNIIIGVPIFVGLVLLATGVLLTFMACLEMVLPEIPG